MQVCLCLRKETANPAVEALSEWISAKTYSDFFRDTGRYIKIVHLAACRQ